MKKKADVQGLKEIKIARKAFEAYERAVEAASQALDDGPVRGLGTAVMVKQQSSAYAQARFECSECKNSFGASEDWKFCPCCGSEIVRFDLSVDQSKEAPTTVIVTYKE